MLKLEQVSFSKGNASLLENINIEMFKGERLALVGPSGAGKTTLLRLLNRLIEPTKGKILWQGQSIKQFPVKTVRTELVLVPQEAKLLGMRVKEAIVYPLKLQRLPIEEIQERLDYYLRKWTVLDSLLERREWELSLGQRQIVALLRALVMRPKILLLDEPTSALDLATAEKVIELLLEVSLLEQITIIMVNHQFELLKQLTTRILYLQEGRLLEDIPVASGNWSTLKEQLVNFQTDSDF